MQRPAWSHLAGGRAIGEIGFVIPGRLFVRCAECQVPVARFLWEVGENVRFGRVG
jgi:hypothetical protein